MRVEGWIATMVASRSSLASLQHLCSIKRVNSGDTAVAIGPVCLPSRPDRATSREFVSSISSAKYISEGTFDWSYEENSPSSDRLFQQSQPLALAFKSHLLSSSPLQSHPSEMLPRRGSGKGSSKPRLRRRRTRAVFASSRRFRAGVNRERTRGGQRDLQLSNRDLSRATI
jgi:hypothetical protein